MADWSYGTAGDKYPVKTGEMWSVGEHLFACGDLEENMGARLLDVAGIQPSVSYCDPPFNKSQARSFRSKAGVGRQVDFDLLLTKVVQQVKQAKTYAFVEMGTKNAHVLKNLITFYGGVVSGQWEILYYKKNPCVLIAAYFHGDPGWQLPDLSGLDDSMTPRVVLSAMSRNYDGKSFVVYDPCIGRGLTAIAGVRVGARVLGVELHPRRLAVALEKTAKLTGLEPKFEKVL